MKGLVGAFNQEKALVGHFSVITNLRMELFQALVEGRQVPGAAAEAPQLPRLLAGLPGPAHQHEGDDRGHRARLGL